MDARGRARRASALAPEPKLTGDQKYLCKAMGTKLPLLPVHGEHEYKLFTSLMLMQSSSTPNFHEMAITWCQHVDGVNIWP